MGEQDIVDAAVAEFHAGHPISDLPARVIASQWHGGQTSALYSFASCGNTQPLDDLLGEIDSEIYLNADTPNRAELETLRAYVERVGARGPVTGWSRLSW